MNQTKAAYLDLRWPDRAWRDGRSGLARWLDVVGQRPSRIATQHQAMP